MQKIVTSLAALSALVIAMAIGGFPTVIAQEIRESAPPAVEETASEESDIPEDQFNRGTPRRTTEGFIAAVDAGDFEKAAN